MPTFFRNEKYYEAPVIEGLPNTLAVLDSIQRQKAFRQKQQQDLEANHKISLDTGRFVSTTKDLTKEAIELERMSRDYFMKGGRGLPREVTERMVAAKGKADLDETLLAAREQKTKEIEVFGKEHPYWDVSPYHKALLQTNADNITQEDIEDIINSTNPGEGNLVNDPILELYDIGADADKYVSDAKKSSFSTETTDKSGVQTKRSKSAPFMKNGVIGVQEDDITNFLQNPDRSRYFQAQLNKQLLDEGTKLKQRGVKSDPDGKFKGIAFTELSDEEIVEELRNNPKVNVLNKTLPRDREFAMAKELLERRNYTEIINNTDYSKQNPDAGRGITSVQWGQGYSFNPNFAGGPGGILTNKKAGVDGMPIRVPGVVFDKVNKKWTGNRDTYRDMYAIEYNLVPTDVTGHPVDTGAKSPQDLIRWIDERTPHDLSTLKLKMVVNGQSYNKADISNARNELTSLQLKSGRTDEEETRMQTFSNTLKELDINEELAPEILKKNLGVFVEDLMKVIDINDSRDGTARAIATKLGEGQFMINDTKTFDEDMKEVYEHFNRKKNLITPKEQLKPSPEKQIKSIAEEFNLKIPAKAEAVKPAEVKLKASYKDDKGKEFTIDELRNRYTPDELKELLKYKVFQ